MPILTASKRANEAQEDFEYVKPAASGLCKVYAN